MHRAVRNSPNDAPDARAGERKSLQLELEPELKANGGVIDILSGGLRAASVNEKAVVVK